jgi:hypothetical protein
MDPEFTGKAFFFASENWEWFDDQVDLTQLELIEADGVEDNDMLKIENVKS